MTSSNITNELDQAMHELDVFFETLTQNERYFQPENKSSYLDSSFSCGIRSSSTNDDDDYDIPRPAESIFNSPNFGRNKKEARMRCRVENAANLSQSKSESDDIDYSMIRKLNFVTPDGSEYSSGHGTLPTSKKEACITFPGPPDFSPPPILLNKHSDSDYDEVAYSSDDEDSVTDSSRSTKRPYSVLVPSNLNPISSANEIKTVVEAAHHSSQVSITVEDPDYDDVYSSSDSRRSSCCDDTNNLPTVVDVTDGSGRYFAACTADDDAVMCLSTFKRRRTF